MKWTVLDCIVLYCSVLPTALGCRPQTQLNLVCYLLAFAPGLAASVRTCNSIGLKRTVLGRGPIDSIALYGTVMCGTDM